MTPRLPTTGRRHAPQHRTVRVGRLHPVIRLLRLPLAIVLSFAPILSIRAQEVDATGRLTGTVRSALNDVAVPYAVVTIPALSIERFSDASGQFGLARVPAGAHDVVIRRVGFVPSRRRVQVQAGQATSLSVVMQPLPTGLTRVAVRAMASCRNPGMPDPVLQAQVSQLVTLLRENADTYRLLVSQYPFSYVQIAAIGEVSDSAFLVQRVDTTVVAGLNPRRYREGNIVSSSISTRGTREYQMDIPTIVELTDDAFIRSHCFGYGGMVQEGGETWYRINMLAADRLRGPDAHGAFFLDSATSQLRRMELDMSRVDRLPPMLRGVAAIHAVTSFTELAPGVPVIASVCAITRLRPGRAQQRASPAELQQLVGYRFTMPPPGINARVIIAAPTWKPMDLLPQSTVWCDR